MSLVEVYKPYQKDKLRQLAVLSQRFSISTTNIERDPSREVDFSIPNPTDPYGEAPQQYHVTPTVAFGMFLCLRSLREDLAKEGLESLAKDITERFK